MTNDFNSLTNFIAKDLAASQKLNPLRWTVALTALLIPTAINLSMGHNVMIEWRESWVPWGLALLFALTVIVFAKNLGKQLNIRIFRTLGAIVLLGGLLLPTLSSGFAPMSGYPEFWSETLQCFAFGLLTGCMTGFTLAAAVFMRGPIPTASTRMALSQIAGMAGVVGLFFHCPNSDWVHLFTGHGSQAAAVFLSTFFITERAFAKAVKHQLGATSAKFEQFARFDR
jgi:hypothetical protein